MRDCGHQTGSDSGSSRCDTSEESEAEIIPKRNQSENRTAAGELAACRGSTALDLPWQTTAQKQGAAQSCNETKISYGHSGRCFASHFYFLFSPFYFSPRWPLP